jgi:Domain of unknown function (DUF4145)
MAALQWRRVSDSTSKFDDMQRARRGETVAPAFGKDAFHCLFCGVLASQTWTQFQRGWGSTYYPTPIWSCRCANCHLESYWREGTEHAPPLRIDPVGGNEPLPHPEMPEDVRVDYEEARTIADRSPRGASALLRLAVQKLMRHLGQPGKDLNKDIGALVQGGLDPTVQQALDALRVIGNNAVHPGELDLRDDPETAHALFEVLNFVIEQQLERPKKLKALYDALPESARQQVERRDGQASPAV